MNTRTYRYWAWNFTAFVILSMGFYNNSWKVADPKLIKNKPNISESMVMGRLAQSQKEGLFTGGGFMGWVLLPGDTLVNYPYQS